MLLSSSYLLLITGGAVPFFFSFLFSFFDSALCIMSFYGAEILKRFWPIILCENGALEKRFVVIINCELLSQ